MGSANDFRVGLDPHMVEREREYLNEYKKTYREKQKKKRERKRERERDKDKYRERERKQLTALKLSSSSFENYLC